MSIEEQVEFIHFNDRVWTWPIEDRKLKLVNGWVRDLDRIPWPKERRVAIQAGGACGIWPVALAGIFETVHTYEPHPVNFYCLMKNTYDVDNVTCHFMGLGNRRQQCMVKLPPEEQNNFGAFYLVPAKEDEQPDITVMPLDAHDYRDVDFIQLDVEGREVEVLEGAELTIEEYRPMIMIEEKMLPQMSRDVKNKPGDAHNWLTSKGYKKIMDLHRDLVFVKK